MWPNTGPIGDVSRGVNGVHERQYACGKGPVWLQGVHLKVDTSAAARWSTAPDQLETYFVPCSPDQKDAAEGILTIPIQSSLSCSPKEVGGGRDELAHDIDDVGYAHCCHT
jgi:hypothetical protein